MIGKRIYGSRLAIDVGGKSMTQAQLAERIARFTGGTLSRNSISLWEKGDVKEITYLNMLGLAHALKKNPEWIRTGKGPERSEDGHIAPGAIHYVPRLSPEAIDVAVAWTGLNASVQKCIALLIEDLSGFAPKKATQSRSR